VSKKIDKLQREVDQLFEVCAEAGSDELLEDYAPTAEEKKYQRLGIMALQLQDGVLEQRYFLRMEKWLRTDPSALQYYVDFQNISAMLYAQYSKSRFTKVLDFIKGCFSHA
jgi:hypothetical protein